MANQLNVSNISKSDMENAVDDYEVYPMSTDGVSDQDETTYMNSRWTQQWGYFNSVPDLKSAILMKAIWNVGKGYTCNTQTQAILDSITGMHKESFEEILFNMEVIKYIGGDSYAEIIRREDGELLNLKPLSPEVMRHVVDRSGRLIRFEQVSRIKGKNPKVFKPEEILWFSNNRLADQIHGISDIDALEKTILTEEESHDDVKRIMHRQARPLIIFKLKTDNTTKIATIISKIDEAVNKGENVYLPDDENVLSYEVVQANPSPLVLEWRNHIKNKFYRSLGLPSVIFGNSGATESGGKIEYLAHEQIFERSQRQIEKAIWNQLAIEINLIPPTTLLENLQADEGKDAQNALTFQASDLSASRGR